jgi:hypothetical protein
MLQTLEHCGSQAVPADLAGDLIRSTLTFVLKTQHTPICGVLKVVQTRVVNR